MKNSNKKKWAENKRFVAWYEQLLHHPIDSCTRCDITTQVKAVQSQLNDALCWISASQLGVVVYHKGNNNRLINDGSYTLRFKCLLCVQYNLINMIYPFLRVNYIGFLWISCCPFSVKACTDLKTRIYMNMKVGRPTYKTISLLNVSCNLWEAVYIVQKTKSLIQQKVKVTNTGFICGIDWL